MFAGVIKDYYFIKKKKKNQFHMLKDIDKNSPNLTSPVEKPQVNSKLKY